MSQIYLNSPIFSRFLQFERNLGHITTDVDLTGQGNLDQFLRINTKQLRHDVDDVVVFISKDCIVVVISISIINLKWTIRVNYRVIFKLWPQKTRQLKSNICCNQSKNPFI